MDSWELHDGVIHVLHINECGVLLNGNDFCTMVEYAIYVTLLTSFV